MRANNPRRFYFTLIAILSLLFSVFVYYSGFRKALTGLNQPVSILLRKNTGLSSLAKKLKARGWVKSTLLVLSIAYLQGTDHLHFGEYWVRPGETLSELLIKMSKATDLVQHKITFAEGVTFQQMLWQLAADPYVDHSLEGDSPEAVMQSLGLPVSSPEGLFFPDTYTYTWGVSDKTILLSAYREMQTKLTEFWATRSRRLPYRSPYQALIAASLIQSEVALPSEAPLVSSVIVNRLKKHMRLQIDPTVMYGLQLPFGSELTRQDLRSVTPYNTYLIRGLPPTPINMPGAVALQSAVHPASSTYLYYVSDNQGGHFFSSNYLEHRRAVARYRARQRKSKNDVSRTTDGVASASLPPFQSDHVIRSHGA